MSNDSRRRSAVMASAVEAGVDGILLTTPANVRYLCGFTGSNGWLLLGGARAVFFTDPRYADQVAAEVCDADVEVSSKGLAGAAGAAIERLGLRRVGFEAQHVTVALRDKLEGAADADWVPLEGTVEAVRGSKDEDEIGAIRAALALTEAALSEVAGSIVAGRTEVEIAAALEHACRRRGATRMAFDTIVASGARTALPHGVASQRVIAAGEPLMIDMGCVLDGYCSDLTRMVWVGDAPDAAWLELHGLVDRAREAALAALRPGTPCSQVDGAAREVIAAAGHADAFRHGTGHGLGLEVHEKPALSARSDDHLEEGMVVTIEPAVYLTGTYGVRIEDIAVVTASGCARLTALGTEPILPGTA